ncbi:Nuclear condensin complex subunit 3 C-terminal domain-containing protein [Entamoeba marina]
MSLDSNSHDFSVERLQSILTKVQALNQYSHYVNELITCFNDSYDNFNKIYKGVVPQLLKLKLKTKPVLHSIDFLVEVAVKANGELTEYQLKIHSDLTKACDVLVRQRSVYIIMRILNSLPSDYMLPEDLHQEIQDNLVLRMKDKSADVRMYAALALKRFQTPDLKVGLSDSRAQVVVATLQSITIDTETVIDIIRLVGDSRATVRQYAFECIQNVSVNSITHTSLCYIFKYGLTEEKPSAKTEFENLVKKWIDEVGFEEFFRENFVLNSIPQLPQEDENDNRTSLQRYAEFSKDVIKEVMRITQAPAGVSLIGEPSEIILRAYALVINNEGSYPDGQEVLDMVIGKSELEKIALLMLYQYCEGGIINILEQVRGCEQIVLENGFRALCKMDSTGHFGQIVDELRNLSTEDKAKYLMCYYRICIELSFVLPKEFLNYNFEPISRELQSSDEDRRVFSMEFLGLTALVNKEIAPQYLPVFIAGLSRDTTPVRLVSMKCLTDYHLLTGIDVPEETRDILNEALLSLTDDESSLCVIVDGIARLYLNDRIHLKTETTELCLAKTLISLFIRSLEGSSLRSMLFSFFLCYSQAYFDDSKTLFEYCLDEAGPELQKIVEVYIPMLAQQDKDIFSMIVEMCTLRLDMLINIIDVYYELDYVNYTTDMKDVTIQRLKTVQATDGIDVDVHSALSNLLDRFNELD